MKIIKSITIAFALAGALGFAGDAPKPLTTEEKLEVAEARIQLLSTQNQALTAENKYLSQRLQAMAAEMQQQARVSQLFQRLIENSGAEGCSLSAAGEWQNCQPKAEAEKPE